MVTVHKGILKFYLILSPFSIIFVLTCLMMALTCNIQICVMFDGLTAVCQLIGSWTSVYRSVRDRR
jgi:hypothetical protein